MFPLSFNLQKITLIEALRYAVPLVPGSIIVASAAMASPNAFHDFMHIPELRYYAKLLLLLAAAYLVGLVLDEIVTLVVGGTFGVLAGWLIRAEERRKIIDKLIVAVAPWRDPTWQKIGHELSGLRTRSCIGE
jgi:hypothetical protein